MCIRVGMIGPLVLAVVALSGCGPMTSGRDVGDLLAVLDDGDVGAGRDAFVGLSCSACHRVTGDPELPSPVSAIPGPDLGGTLARKTTCYLTASIVAPSHIVTPAVPGQGEGTLSPMGDYSEAMTVRQLLDVIAYIRSLEPETSG